MNSHISIDKIYVRQIDDGLTPYQVDENIYKRFDQRNNLTVGRPNWDENIQYFTRKAQSTRIRQIAKKNSGYNLEDYSLFFSSGVVASRLETSINQSNRGLLSWNSLGSAAEEDMVAPDLPLDLSKWSGSPEKATKMIQRVARFFGADLVGIAPLDRRWIFSHSFWNDGTHKEIVFRETNQPLETEQELIIPENMKWVIIMGVRMTPDIIGLSPCPTGCAETQRTYSHMAALVSQVAEFLRGIGYKAIPSLNDLGLNIPIAIDAGFGEQGRNGKLISPQFGPAVRLCKVITDLPLMRNFPIQFGVKQFCNSCKKCAAECPVQAIPYDEPTWNGSSFSNNPGIFTWHLNDEACRKYWAIKPGTNCTICIRACPFSKNTGFIHDIARFFISYTPQLNPLLVKLDTLMGYGEQSEVEMFWE